MKRVFRITSQGKVEDVGRRGLVEHPEVERVDTTVALLQALIPLGLQAVGEALEAEVVRLAGPRHSRTGRRPGHVRWGAQPGSVYLLDQKLHLPVPRVRDRSRNREVALPTYRAIKNCLPSLPWDSPPRIERVGCNPA